MECKNCKRFTPSPFQHSFSTALEQTKNQAWQTRNSSWIVTPTSSLAPSLTGTCFCSGDCLFSYLLSHDLLSCRSPDLALHFFKRAELREQQQWLATQQPLAHADDTSHTSLLMNDAAALAAAVTACGAGGLDEPGGGVADSLAGNLAAAAINPGQGGGCAASATGCGGSGSSSGGATAAASIAATTVDSVVAGVAPSRGSTRLLASGGTTAGNANHRGVGAAGAAGASTMSADDAENSPHAGGGGGCVPVALT